MADAALSDSGAIVREAFVLFATACAPFLLPLLVVGLIVGVLQAATQINDPAVGFLPRAIVGVVTAWLAGPLVLERLAAFFVSTCQRLGP